jgi:CHAT domain-containing protein
LLAPSDKDDGRVFSVDILAQNLSGLSVLALSACETAIGRFDGGDNLRGISASAIASGAECVIGTLWEANDEACEVFFAEFFANLAADSTRREAFRNAQIKTRAAFPEYRDWGPFYMSGLW